MDDKVGALWGEGEPLPSSGQMTKYFQRVSLNLASQSRCASRDHDIPSTVAVLVIKTAIDLARATLALAGHVE
jgi:hypothetical protein